MSIVISLFIYRATSRLLLDKFLMQMEQCIDRQCDDAQCVPSFSSMMCMSDYEVIGTGFLILSSMNQFIPYLMISNLSELFIRYQKIMNEIYAYDLQYMCIYNNSTLQYLLYIYFYSRLTPQQGKGGHGGGDQNRMQLLEPDSMYYNTITMKIRFHYDDSKHTTVVKFMLKLFLFCLLCRTCISRS